MSIELHQKLTQEQTLILTQTMRQALECLQMPVAELGSFLEEAALSNPLLEVELPPHRRVELELVERRGEAAAQLGQADWQIWSGGREEEPREFTDWFSRPESYRDHLTEQLKLMRELDDDMLQRCLYLVGCLNSAGYLDCPLEELARETGSTRFDMEQALFVLQALDPPGTGARNLSECLLVQLAQGRQFTQTNVRLIQEGLPLMAAGDEAGLARLLGVSRKKAAEAGEVIRSLNPIPSRGFYAERQAAYVLPEATVHVREGRLLVEMEEQSLPQTSLREDYCAMLENPEHGEAHDYLRDRLEEARELLQNVHHRNETLRRVIRAVVDHQQSYFLSGGALAPLTMQALAEELDLSVSTVSRTVRDKYLQFQGHMLPLRSFFSSAVASSGDTSADTARQYLRSFLLAEDPAHPLSDAALAEALSGVGVTLSRRTVAKYRGEMGVGPASARKKTR